MGSASEGVPPASSSSWMWLVGGQVMHVCQVQQQTAWWAGRHCTATSPAAAAAPSRPRYSLAIQLGCVGVLCW